MEVGIENLIRHIDNIKNKYGIAPIVGINKYANDSQNEIQFLKKKLKEIGVELSLLDVWANGGDGAIDLAQKIVKYSENESTVKFVYDDKDSIKEKILKVAKEVYGAEDVEYTETANLQIKQIEEMGYREYPVCIAKTQYSFSDDAKNLLCNEPYNIHIKEVIVKNGAEFVVVKTGKIFTMPGLPRHPAAENIGINENGDVEGIF